MPRRTIVDTNECVICKLAIIDTDARLKPSDIFARGYIAGIKVTSHGKKSDEKVCTDHNDFLNSAVKSYIGRGVKL